MRISAQTENIISRCMEIRDKYIISQSGIAKRGRFHAMDAQTINHILCRKILIEE